MKIVEIYNVIEYLKAHDVEFTYSRYLQQINTHTEAMKHEKNHVFWCETHIGFVERAMKNIGYHIAATNNAILLINKRVGPPPPDDEENVLQ